MDARRVVLLSRWATLDDRLVVRAARLALAEVVVQVRRLQVQVEVLRPQVHEEIRFFRVRDEVRRFQAHLVPPGRPRGMEPKLPFPPPPGSPG